MALLGLNVAATTSHSRRRTGGNVYPKETVLELFKEQRDRKRPSPIASWPTARRGRRRPLPRTFASAAASRTGTRRRRWPTWIYLVHIISGANDLEIDYVDSERAPS